MNSSIDHLQERLEKRNLESRMQENPSVVHSEDDDADGVSMSVQMIKQKLRLTTECKHETL